MAQPSLFRPANADSKKRKEPPTNPSNSRKDNKRPKNGHRAKQRDARTLAVQTSSRAFKNGQLDVDSFVKSREYEIKALEEGMTRSKQALTKRAFQQVPKDLRRRTASHNAKRVPKRLQPRAKREMMEDNTPTVTSRRRKPTRHMRLRLETVKKLRALGAKRKSAAASSDGNTVTVETAEGAERINAAPRPRDTAIVSRAPKVKKSKLAVPPKPKAKFRKRQIDKTWMPTHMFHAKRARMTPPNEALWRFAIPVTPTAKSYRPTHRAANERGAVAWDMSYMSTIRLQGQQRNLDGILTALQFTPVSGKGGIGGAGIDKWRSGCRVCTGFAFAREAPHRPIAPVTAIWSALPKGTTPSQDEDSTKPIRALFLRVHPSAFLQLWEELVRLGKVAKPQVTVEDLRYEIGSIEMTGPSAVEALLGALWASGTSNNDPSEVARTWNSLAGLHDSSLLPPDILLAFEMQDPRLHHPPRTIKLPYTPDEQQRLLELTASWSLQSHDISAKLFDRRARQVASSALSSQKSINRRKAAATPGQFPDPIESDPRIPVLVYSSCARPGNFWTVLLPWKCVQPVWYSIMYYPLSTGGQPRFGGLDEKRQLAFESGHPWFPGDYPGTNAGWMWEMEQREKRKGEWARRPRSKRVNWDVVDVGNGVKGEVGLGWACDWERLLDGPPKQATIKTTAENITPDQDIAMSDVATDRDSSKAVVQQSTTPHVTFLLATTASQILKSPITLPIPPNAIFTINLSCLTRGTPQTCARIYRLPSKTAHPTLGSQWLSLHPKNNPRSKTKTPKHALPRLPPNASTHEIQRRLAQSLLSPPQAGEAEYPPCPGEEDLIGFITTGNLNLSEGRGTGVGNLLLRKVAETWETHSEEEGRICVVRNSGQSVGRLARWDFV